MQYLHMQEMKIGVKMFNFDEFFEEWWKAVGKKQWLGNPTFGPELLYDNYFSLKAATKEIFKQGYDLGVHNGV